jgi:hypothetical protein
MNGASNLCMHGSASLLSLMTRETLRDKDRRCTRLVAKEHPTKTVFSSSSQGLDLYLLRVTRDIKPSHDLSLRLCSCLFDPTSIESDLLVRTVLFTGSDGFGIGLGCYGGLLAAHSSYGLFVKSTFVSGGLTSVLAACFKRGSTRGRGAES